MGTGFGLMAEMVTLPIAFRDGGIADVEFRRGSEGGRLVCIRVPKRAAYVNSLNDEKPVQWLPIDLGELFLPEDIFSPEFLARFDATRPLEAQPELCDAAAYDRSQG
jgi:hypothetical protein